MNLLRAIAAHLHNLAATFASRGEVDALDARLRARIDGDVYCTDTMLIGEADDTLAIVNALSASDWAVWESECSKLQRLANQLGRAT